MRSFQRAAFAFALLLLISPPLSHCNYGNEVDGNESSEALLIGTLNYLIAQQEMELQLSIRSYDREIDANPLSFSNGSGTSIDIDDLRFELNRVVLYLDPLPDGGLFTRLKRQINPTLHADHGIDLNLHSHRLRISRSAGGPLQLRAGDSTAGKDSGDRPYFETIRSFRLPPGEVVVVALYFERIRIEGRLNGSDFTYDRSIQSEPAVELKCRRTVRNGQSSSSAIILDLKSIFNLVTPTNYVEQLSVNLSVPIYLSEHECHIF